MTVEANGTADVVSAQQAQHGDDEPQAALRSRSTSTGDRRAEIDGPKSTSRTRRSPTSSTEPPLSRFTIHTARYRLTLKGVDRGKWEVDVVAEADAPLDAVDAVVRGVQRRSGEGAEPDRLTTESVPRSARRATLAAGTLSRQSRSGRVS